MSKRILDEDILACMDQINAGELTQKDLAMRLGVTPSALNQRIKKLKRHQLPESALALTEKQRRFAIAKAHGATNIVAAKDAFDCTTDSSAKSMATVLMRDPDVNTAIQDLMHTAGIGRRRRVERLRDVIECADLSVASRGLDMAARMTGDYTPERIEIISDVEIRALVAYFSARPIMGAVEETGTAGAATVTEGD